MKKISILSLLFVLLSFGITHAQSPDQLRLTATPANPGTHEKVSVVLTSYLINLEENVIAWSVNGKKVTESAGPKLFEFETGGPGSTNTVTASVKDGAKVVSKSITFKPIELELIWEADTYTPPSYRGHTQATSESIINVSALPVVLAKNGSRIDPSTLIYTWKKDNLLSQNSSGLGRQTFTFTSAKTYGKNLVNVTVTDKAGTFTTSKTITIPVSKPEVLLYQDRPLEGVLYERALPTEIRLRGSELYVRPEPYFFSDIPFGISNEWTLNGQSIIPPEAASVLFKTGDQSGISQVESNLRNLSRVLQIAKNSLKIHFIGSTTENF